MAVVLSSLVYTNLVFWHSAFFGWLILLTVCLYTGAEAHNFLNKFFNLSKSLRIRVLAIFLVLLIWGSVAGMLALIFKMSSFVLTVSVLITILGFDWLNLLVGERIEIIPEIDDENKKVLEEFPAAKLGVLLYIILILAGFYFLANSQTSAAILTPWQVIPTHYIWIFFAATLVLGLLIFSKLKSGVLLFLLILHSLLLHAYLPLTHVLFYGADGWRHLALESSWWTQGTLMSPTLSSVPVSIWQRFDFGSLAYAQFSSLALIFQKLCQVDPLSFMRNFMPIVWSVVLPILLFEIARTFAWEKRAALFLVWLAALSFALQASGSFSLPVNLGMLFWVFALLLQIKNRTNFSKAGLIFLFGLGVLFLFGHALFFILFWLGFGLLWLIKSKTSEIKLFFVAIFTAAVIPVLELISHYSDFNPQINWWTQIKFLVGNFVVWYLAVGNYTHDISAGNIFSISRHSMR